MKNLLKRVPRFEKACCCIPLRAGVITTVYLNVILCALVTVTFLYFDFIKVFYRMFTMNREDYMSKMIRSKLVPEVMFFLPLIIFIADLTMAIVGLIGIHCNKLNLIKIYLHYSVGIAFFTFFFRMFDVGPFWFVEVPIVFLLMGIKIYFILLVRSLVKKLEGNITDKEETRTVEMSIVKNGNEKITIKEHNGYENPTHLSIVKEEDCTVEMGLVKDEKERTDIKERNGYENPIHLSIVKEEDCTVDIESKEEKELENS